MKTTMTLLAAAVIVLTAAFASTAHAQVSEDAITEQYKFAFENLAEGITSDNYGVRRSSIYFAGEYKLQKAVEPLVEQLEREEDPQLRILIGLSLYQIGASDGMEKVQELANNDKNDKVRAMFSQIYQTHLFRTMGYTAVRHEIKADFEKMKIGK